MKLFWEREKVAHLVPSATLQSWHIVQDGINHGEIEKSGSSWLWIKNGKCKLFASLTELLKVADGAI